MVLIERIERYQLSRILPVIYMNSTCKYFMYKFKIWNRKVFKNLLNMQRTKYCSVNNAILLTYGIKKVCDSQIMIITYFQCRVYWTINVDITRVDINLNLQTKISWPTYKTSSYFSLQVLFSGDYFRLLVLDTCVLKIITHLSFDDYKPPYILYKKNSL